MQVGLQSWTVREIVGSNPNGFMDKLNDFDFIELAGTGSLSCKRLACVIDAPPPPILGAHICSMASRSKDVGEIVAQYFEGFSELEWVAFFFDPSDIKSMTRADQRANVYKKYRDQLDYFSQAIRQQLGDSSPKVVYHTYPMDFWPIDNGEPAFSQLGSGVEIQLDTYFARLAGFLLTDWLKAYSESDWKQKVHSIHASGFTEEGNHDVIPHLDTKEGADFAKLISAAEIAGIKRFVVEHEINPNKLDHAMQSLNNFRSFLQGASG